MRIYCIANMFCRSVRKMLGSIEGSIMQVVKRGLVVLTSLITCYRSSLVIRTTHEYSFGTCFKQTVHRVRLGAFPVCCFQCVLTNSDLLSIFKLWWKRHLLTNGNGSQFRIQTRSVFILHRIHKFMSVSLNVHMPNIGTGAGNIWKRFSKRSTTQHMIETFETN